MIRYFHFKLEILVFSQSAGNVELDLDIVLLFLVGIILLVIIVLFKYSLVFFVYIFKDPASVRSIKTVLWNTKGNAKGPIFSQNLIGIKIGQFCWWFGILLIQISIWLYISILAFICLIILNLIIWLLWKIFVALGFLTCFILWFLFITLSHFI